jgi:spermidine synthase
MMTRHIPPPLPAVVALGVAGQIGQILLLRELLMVFHGNELSIGVILAAWMIWVGVGSRWGSLLVERSRRPLALLAGQTVGILILLPATVWFARGLRGFFDVLPGTYLSLTDLLVASFLVTAPVGLLLGAQFVLLARLWRERDRAADTTAAGKTYIGEALGTIVGGLLFAFILVHHANAFQAAILAGLLMLAAAIRATRATAPGHGHGMRVAVWVALAGGALALPFLQLLDDWSHRLQWRSFAPEQTLVATHPSRYGNISVARREDQYSFFQSGHLVFSAAGPEARTPALEEQEGAIFAHFALTQHQNPRHVLLIGGGLRGTLREIARHPVERIDYVELDETLIAAARPHLPAATIAALEDPRVRVKHLDGRLFVKATEARYDLILIDVPDPATAVLNRFYTVEFFQEAAARLHPDGVLVIGVTSTPDLRGSAVANRNATLHHTLSEVFPHVLPVGERFLFFFASRDPDQLSADPRALQERFRARNIETDGFSPRQFDLLLEEGPLRRVNWILRHHGRQPGAHLEAPRAAPLFPGSLAEQAAEERHWPPVQRHAFINSDFRPIGYYYTLVFWNVLARGDHAGAFQWIARVQAWWLLPALGTALLTALVLREFGRRRGGRADVRFAVRFAVFTTGFSTMALQIALLFAFQSIYGFVYEMVGLIVAIFMAGLLLGTTITQRWVIDKANIRLLAGVQLLIALFAGLIAVALPEAAALHAPAAVFALFSGLTFAGGLLNGLDFPLATACCLALDRRAEQATGRVYGLELFGACLGAALASVVVAPVLGIVACGLLAAAVNATAFGVLMIVRKTDAKSIS